MRKIFKSALAVFLLLSLSVGVLDLYLQSCAEVEKIEMSDAADGDEVDFQEEVFSNRVLFESSTAKVSVVISDAIISLWLIPSCILEGHTGIVTPPPWA